MTSAMCVPSWQAFAKRHEVRQDPDPQPRPANAVSINDLPVEILRNIFKHLNIINKKGTTFTMIVEAHTWRLGYHNFHDDCVLENASILKAMRTCRLWRDLVRELIVQETTSLEWNEDGWQTREILQSIRDVERMCHLGSWTRFRSQHLNFHEGNYERAEVRWPGAGLWKRLWYDNHEESEEEYSRDWHIAFAVARYMRALDGSFCSCSDPCFCQPANESFEG